jgi:hypothetical protein
MASKNIPPCPWCDHTIADMISPRRLPCGHVFCEKCLIGQLGTFGHVACATCQKVLDSEIRLDTLPLDYGEDNSCDGCMKRGISCKATHYCRECSNKMCDKHTEVFLIQLNITTNVIKCLCQLKCHFAFTFTCIFSVISGPQ